MKLQTTPVAGAWSEQLARSIDRAFRDIGTILNGGVRFADQTRVRTFSFNTAHAPVRVEVGGKVPLSLLVLRIARIDSLSDVVSGSPISWTWDGRSAAVSAIDGAAVDTDYAVTVLVMEG